MFVEHAHALHERELRLVLSENHLRRGFTAFLQNMNKGLQMFHVDGYYIKAE